MLYLNIIQNISHISYLLVVCTGLSRGGVSSAGEAVGERPCFDLRWDF